MGYNISFKIHTIYQFIARYVFVYIKFNHNFDVEY